VIVDYIDSYRGRFGVEPICAVLAEAGIAIAPSTYYARCRARLTEAELADACLANQLRSQDHWQVYGVRKLWHAARRVGHNVGRDRVARLDAAGRDQRGGPREASQGDHRDRPDRGTAPGCGPTRLACPTDTDQLWAADFSYGGRWPASSTSRSSSRCSPAGSWAGG
jgi:hypothetical protein